MDASRAKATGTGGRRGCGDKRSKQAGPDRRPIAVDAAPLRLWNRRRSTSIGRDADAARGAHSLAAVEPHGRRADGGAGQPPARCVRASSSRPERRPPEGDAADGRRRSAAASFPADRDVDDHVYYDRSSFPARLLQEPRFDRGADPNKKIVVTYSSINGNGLRRLRRSGVGDQGHAHSGTGAGRDAVQEAPRRPPVSA